MILPNQMIRERKLIRPFHERTVAHGMTFGVGPAGYDVRIAQDIPLTPGDFTLASTIEDFEIPNDVMAFVYDKSTWARRGLSLFNTVIEPGWCGWLTLELTNHSNDILYIKSGMPIAHIVFKKLLEPTSMPYSGKYQNQPNHPVKAIKE